MTISIKSAARALGGNDYSGNRILCPGPGHSKKDRSLSVTFLLDGSFIANSFAGDDWQACRDHVKAKLGIDDREIPARAEPIQVLPRTGNSHARVDMLGRLWGSCIPIAGTIGEVYLKSRGLTYDGDGWRFRPSSRALIAVITDALTAEPIGWHETRLDAEGRKVNRRMHGRASGGVVRLYDHEPPFGMAITEGIETALATGVEPVWACLSSSIMQGFPVLPGIDCLTVYADHDPAGVKAANAVGERWHAAGREVILTMPSQPGKDFADLMEAA